MRELEYKAFFDGYLNFKTIQEKQKARGFNDFNLLTTVLKYHDEVRLHSRMIGALIDPQGKHYQGTLFLEKFIQSIGLNDFKLNLSNVTVGVEYKDIDLYITDGVKHIIIENKIWAEDQPCQIIKYINIIVEENKSDFNFPIENEKIDENLLQVIYLSPRDKEVSKEHKISNGYIEYKNGFDALNKCSSKMKLTRTIDFELKNYKAKYKKIGYKDVILPWLEVSYNEVNNITNLAESIKQYIDVVKIVTKDYKGKVMTLSNYMDENEELYQYLQELTELKENIEPKFWNELYLKLDDSSFLNGMFNVELNQKSDYKNNTEIKIISKLDKNNFIFIRRNHNSFFGYEGSKNCLKLSEYFSQKDGTYWMHTSPKINFKKYNQEYWNIAKPSKREEAIDSILEDVKELIAKIKILKLV